MRSLLWYLGSILSPSTYTPNVADSGMSGEENISYSSPSRKEPVHMGLQALGAYIAMASDECARAIGMVLRWKSGKWKGKSLVEL